MFRQRQKYRSGQTVVAVNLPSYEGVLGGSEVCPDLPVSDVSNREWITDYEHIEWNSGGVAQFNTCRHTRVGGLPRSVSGEYSFGYGLSPTDPVATAQNTDASVLRWAMPHGDLPYNPVGWKVYAKQLSGEPMMGGPVMDGLESFDSSTFDLDAIASDGLKFMGDKVSRFDDLSLPNFLHELKDVPGLIRKLQTIATEQGWSKLLQPGVSKKDLSFELADSYLAYSFGAAPLISDIIRILKALATFRKKLKKLLSELHTIRRITVDARGHAYIPDMSAVSQIHVERPQAVACWVTDAREMQGVVQLMMRQKITPEVGMKYTLYCEELSRINLELRFLCETFGVAWDPAIIWNGVRFSFILDWIWNVADWLSMKRKPTLPVYLRVLDFYIMWKYNFSGRVGAVAFDHTPTLGNISRTTWYNIKGDRFRRQQFMPDYEHLDRARWEKNVIKKTLLGASLVTTSRIKDPVFPRRFDPSNRTLFNIFSDLGIKRNTRRNRWAF